MKHLEIIRWRPIDQLPDEDLDLLLAFGDAAGVLTGAWMGEAEGWVGSAGESVEGVRFWALMPDGPVT